MAPGLCWVRRPHADRSNHGLADSDSPHWVITLPCLEDFIGHSGSRAVADANGPRARDVRCRREKELSLQRIFENFMQSETKHPICKFEFSGAIQVTGYPHLSSVNPRGQAPDPRGG